MPLLWVVWIPLDEQTHKTRVLGYSYSIVYALNERYEILNSETFNEFSFVE